MCILEDGWSVVEGLLKVPVLGEVVRCSGGFRYVRDLIDQPDHQFQFAFQVNLKFGRMVAQSVSVGFQTEITPFPSIDGVGHQSLSLGKTLSVLSLSLSIESPRCQDFLVWSFFLFFKKFFLQFTLCSFCLSSTRNRYSLFHLYVKLYFVFLFMFVGCFSPQYIYPQKRTHVYP